MATGRLRRTFSLAILAVLVALLGRLAWSRWGSLGAAEATLQGAYPTEELWIAGEIAKDVVEMAHFARDPGARSGDVRVSVEPMAAGEPGPGVKVSFTAGDGKPSTQSIRWQRHIWSPEDYEPFARVALGGLPQTKSPAQPSEDERTLAALLTPTAGVIETQNQRVSQRLQRDMLDANAHEEAALVVGTLILREAAEVFSDVRQLMCRMAAHLSLARALRNSGSYGLSGRYADAILASSSGRTVDAFRMVDTLQQSASASEVQQAWIRALRLRITEDWRALPDPAQRTLLERISHFRVLGSTLGPAAAFDFYASAQMEPVSDWGRIGFASNFSTEVGGWAAEKAVAELAEAREVWSRMQRGQLSAAAIVDELNRPAGRCMTPEGPRVLGWGTWAAAIQRHVCHRVLRIDRYWRYTVALPDRAASTLAAFDRQFGGLDLYPFVQGLRWKHGDIELESFSGALNTGVATAARRPELLPAYVWHAMADTAHYAVTRRRMPAPRPWFAALAPSGTAYDAESRALIPHFEQGTEPLSTVHDRNPWSSGLGGRVVTVRHGANPTPEQIRSVLGARVDYDLGVLRWSATAAGGRSPDRARLLQQACALLADECVGLAFHLMANGRDQEAIQALQEAFDRALDRVGLTHNILPLVRHYHERGQHAEATRVAADAADTGSANGMEAMGLLLEWRGDLEGAEDHLQQIDKRYDDKKSLVGFYKRMVDAGRKEYASKLQSGMRGAFPGGLEKLDPAQLPRTPTDGVGFANPGPDAPLAGVEAGDIVVGLDGWRVHDEAQYTMVREFDWRPDLTLYLWRKGHYMELRPHALSRLLGVDIHTHPTDKR